MKDYSVTLSTRGSNASTQLLLGLMKALQASGCSLAGYDYSGDYYRASNTVTVRGDDQAILVFKSVISGWSNS